MNLRLVAEDYLNSTINIESVIVTLDEMLGRINPQYQSTNVILRGDCRDNFEMFSKLVRYLSDRQDGSPPRRIFYETTDAIWLGVDGLKSRGRTYLQESKSRDIEEGLPDQPIMKALKLRSSVEEYIAGGIEISVAAAKLSELLIDIYPEYFTGNEKCDIVALSIQCSNILYSIVDRDHPELWRNGAHAQRIANESMAAFLPYSQGNPAEALKILQASKSNDDDIEITKELNVWYLTYSWGGYLPDPNLQIEPEQNLQIEPEQHLQIEPEKHLQIEPSSP